MLLQWWNYSKVKAARPPPVATFALVNRSLYSEGNLPLDAAQALDVEVDSPGLG